jgi:hypothetical protein
LIYYDTITITSNAGVVAVHVFGSNCLFDPDITGGGHQPAGFDQYMALYQRYTVLRTRAKVTFFNESGVSFLVGMVATDEVAALTDERQYIERGDNNWTSPTIKRALSISRLPCQMARGIPSISS